MNAIKAIKAQIMRNQSAGLYLLLMFIIIGYIFFFSSPYILPGNVNVIATNLLEDISCKDGNTIKIIRSDYSASEQKIQYEFEISENLLRPYEFRAVIRDTSAKTAVYPVSSLVRDGEIYVINIENVSKKWSELQLEIIGIIDSNNAPVATIYSNLYSVSKVDAIPNKSIEEYKIDRANLHINEYNQHINALKYKNDEMWYEIGLLKNLNNSLTEKKKFQTNSEIQKTDLDIENNIVQVESYYSEIKKNETTISEFQKKIEKNNEMIKELSKKQTLQ